jgi:curved DNA-binding protein CbpA
LTYPLSFTIIEELPDQLPARPPVVNYYEILELEHTCGQAEIKRAFRRLLKRFHPDRNPTNPSWADEQTRRLVEAYHVLSDETRRKFHDHQLRLNGRGGPGSASQGFEGGAAALCRRTLTDLLDGNGSRAIKTYETLRGDQDSFDFYPYLSLKDHLDCKFLLGEEYERQGNLRDALTLYEEVYKEELEGPRLRYFLDEVYERIVNIYCHQLVRHPDIEEAAELFEHALDLDLQVKDRAEILKRFAETLLKLGANEKAKRQLAEAVRIRPGLKGVQRLCSRLGIEVAAL